MKFKNSVAFVIVLILTIIILSRNPGDNRNHVKLNELEARINELEKLISVSRANFKLIRSSILEMKSTNNDSTSLETLQGLLNVLQSKNFKEKKIPPLKWSQDANIMCGVMNYSVADLDIGELYKKMDFTDIDGGAWKQGFDITYKSDDILSKKLDIYIVPHSHQDPGWIKTFDEYFSEQTRSILDSMLRFLKRTPDMKFIYAEVSFFQHWWETLNLDDRNAVRKLVRDNQLEIVTGGWVMNDEANSHYLSIVNQLHVGHNWIKDNLGIYPHNAWSVDTFGYSQVMPYLLKKSGLDNLVLQRVHYIVKKELAQKKQLEFRWKQYWDSGNVYSLPSHTMPFFSYDIPHTCGPDPAVCCQFDFQRLFEYACPWKKNPVAITDANVKERAETLLDQYRKKSRLYNNGNVLLVPLGDDFRYKKEQEWEAQYRNYKAIMNYLNSHGEYNVKIQFGTLRDYFNAVGKAQLDKLPLLTGDMFTYADRNEHYWSGYFTSRPFIKIFDRLLMDNVRNAEVLLSLALAYNKKYKERTLSGFDLNELFHTLSVARNTSAYAQHHDVITGTSKAYVMKDYRRRIVEAIAAADKVFLTAAQSILRNKKDGDSSSQLIFNADTVTVGAKNDIEPNFVDLTKDHERFIYLFNSLSYPRQVLINIPIIVNGLKTIKVSGSGNQFVECQVSPYAIGESAYDHNKHHLSFKMSIGPLAFEKFKIIVSSVISDENRCVPSEVYLYNANDAVSDIYKVTRKDSSEANLISFGNELNTFYVNSSSGHVEYVENSHHKKKQNLKITFKSYGVGRNKGEPSGAYLFIADGEGKTLYANEKVPIIHVRGTLSDVMIVKRSVVIQKLAVYHVQGMLAQSLDIDNIVDISSKDDFELSMSVIADPIEQMHSTATFSNTLFADTNCYQFVRRTHFDKLPLQASVYPMTCGAFVESAADGHIHRLSLLSRQANGVRGGSCNHENKPMQYLEVFQDRRLMNDDNRGMFEGVTDNVRVTKQYRLLMEQWEGIPMDRALGQLTFAGHALLTDLNHPVRGLYLRSDVTPIADTDLVGQKGLLTGSGLPCDFYLAGLWADLSNHPMLTLHRVPLLCGPTHLTEGACATTDRKSPLHRSMFDDLTIRYVRRASLTGLYITDKQESPEAISVNTMELEAFELHFDI